MSDYDYASGRSDGRTEGYEAALSEHESIGWWNAKRKRFVPEFSSYEIEAGLVDGYEPVYRRSVEVQSSEVPRTPEEPKA